jgi:hypothetical protein
MNAGGCCSVHILPDTYFLFVDYSYPNKCKWYLILVLICILYLFITNFSWLGSLVQIERKQWRQTSRPCFWSLKENIVSYSYIWSQLWVFVIVVLVALRFKVRTLYLLGSPPCTVPPTSPCPFLISLFFG